MVLDGVAARSMEFEPSKDEIVAAIHDELGAVAQKIRAHGYLGKWRKLLHDQDHLITELELKFGTGDEDQ